MRPGARGLAVLVFLIAGRAAADYRQSYLDGRRALETSRFAEAAAAFQRAAGERPAEQARARLVGAIPEPYLPHHYLGVALFHLRRCPEALAAFATSAQQQVAADVPSAAAEAVARRADCEALAEAEKTLAAAGAAAMEVASATVSAAARRQAEAALERAAADLAAARHAWDFAAVRRALGLARAARQSWEALRPPPPAAPEAPPPAPPASESTPTAPAAPAPAPPSPVAATPRQAVPSPVPAPPESRLSPAAIAAAEAYLAGSYDAVLRLLERAGAASPEERFVVPLLRAAARYALFALGGENDRELETAAGDDVRRAHRVRPRYLPSEAHFSPRFVEFYRRHAPTSGQP